MNKQLKNIGLLAILSLVTVALGSQYITDVYAAGTDGTKWAERSNESSTPITLSLREVADPVQTTTSSAKSFKGVDLQQYDTTQTYRAVYEVENPQNSKVSNVKILVSSDIDSVQEKLQGNWDPKHSVITVLIKANDPASIDARITGFYVN